MKAAHKNTTQLYDALLFIDETTAARQNPGAIWPPRRILNSPQNFDFENSNVGCIPESWNTFKYDLKNFDYKIEISLDRPYQGKKCVKISRDSGKHYGETYWSLSQILNADLYRGKYIKLKVATRANVKGINNKTYLWLNLKNRNSNSNKKSYRQELIITNKN